MPTGSNPAPGGAEGQRPRRHNSRRCRVGGYQRGRAGPADWALGDGADAAIVELGANDGLRGVDPKDMEANLTAILDELASRRIP